MDQLQKFLDTALGPESHPQEMSFAQLVVRALIIFVVMFLMIRIAGRRFLAQKNTVDALLGFLIASMMSRAINGSTNFWGTIALGFTIALVYRALASAACKSH